MKFCPKCHLQYADDVDFCLEDGTRTVNANFPQPEANYSQETVMMPKPNAAPAQGQIVLQKSNVVLVAGLLLGGLFLVVIALGGWLYFKNKKTDELTNTAQSERSSETNGNINTSVADNSNLNNKTFNSNAKISSNLNLKTPAPNNSKDVVLEEEDSSIMDEPSLSATATPKPVPRTISGGVVNGKARNLVTPQYPASARAVRASGQVSVAVTIDEEGNVISASATAGHPLLRSSAEQAARASKFNPTLLSGQPVKVTGVIIYNFVP